jgi:hypothetical protein
MVTQPNVILNPVVRDEKSFTDLDLFSSGKIFPFQFELCFYFLFEEKVTKRTFRNHKR